LILGQDFNSRKELPVMLRCFLLSLLLITLIPMAAYTQEGADNNATTAEVNTGSAQVIAVVDIKQLMLASKAAKSIQKSAEGVREKYQKDIKKIEQSLKDSESAIIKDREKLSKDDFIKKQHEFQKELIESQKKVAEMNKKLDHAVADSLNILREEIVNIVAEMAEKNGYDLVISRQEVVIVAKTMDITAAVMDALNKKLPSVKVKI